MKNIYVYIFIIGVILFIAGLWLSQRVEGFQSTAGLLLAGIGTDGTVYVADSGLTNIPNWSNISGKMTQISGSMGQIVGVNSSQQVWYTKQASAGMASTWKQIPGTATHVGFDFPKLVAVMGSSVGYISDVNVANPAFMTKNAPVALKSIDISLGSAYAIGTNNKVYTCADITASSWSWTDITTGVIVGKTFTHVSCNAGTVAVVTESNELYYAADGRTWVQLTGRAVKGVAVRGGMLYAVGTDNKIYYSPSQTPDASWSSLSGTTAFSYVDCFLPINAQIISERTAGNASCADPTYEVVGAQCMSPCPSGYTANGTTCVQGSVPRATSDPKFPAAVIYSCPSGEIQLSGAICASTQDTALVSNNTPPSEAYSVNGSFTQLEAQAKCESYGATLASYQELENAQLLGAGWCSWGWITDDTANTAKISFPVQTTDSCHSDAPGTKVRLQNGSGKYGANCYGVKPPLSVAAAVRPFNSTKWNQATQCEFGYRVVFNASCKSGCPTGSISDPTYCTYEAVPKTSKAKKIVNFTCPDGYDVPSVTSCSKVKYDDTGKITGCDTPAPTCYQKCPAGTTRNGTTCTLNPVSTTPITILSEAATITYSCPANYMLNSSNTCTEKCPSGYTQNIDVCSTGAPTYSSPTRQCTNPTFPRLYSDYYGAWSCRRETASPGQVAAVTQCPQGTTPSGVYGSNCYTCPVISGTSATLQKPRGLPAGSITCSDIPLRQLDLAATATTSCPADYDLVGTTCYQRCPPGYTRNGTTCTPNANLSTAPSIAARQTLAPTFVAPCETGYKLIGTACYKDCDEGLNDVNTKCQKPSITRTTSETTITKPTTALCAADEEIINKICVKKCAQGKFSTDTSCSASSVARTVVSATFTSPCNSNEDLLNGMCVSKCPAGQSRVGSVCVQGKVRIDSPVCKSSNYGKYKRWLCDSQSDLNTLLKDPSTTTTYVNDNDQVCITSSPTTMMYYCQTVAETNSGGAVLDDIQDVAGATCTNLLKNYIDLSGSIASLQLIRSGMDDGSVSLSTAKDKLTAVYNNLQCNTSTSDLCKSVQTSIGKIGGNVTTINSTKSAIAGPIGVAVQARQELLASIQKFQCSP
jgi:hypothetical protein